MWALLHALVHAFAWVGLIVVLVLLSAKLGTMYQEFELALLLEKHIPESRVFDPVGLVTHFARTIRRELNFDRELRTMREFARRFERDATLYVPRVYEDLSTDSVISIAVESFS